ncbi:MAG: VWA domain-containing protein [Anaerolineae bacterium]|nr:VWA domain-containing protein [Anaerolineae bacterium]
MKRVLLLLLLFVCAITWACLMSVDFWRRQSSVASPEGIVAEVTYVDQAGFPDVTLYLDVRDGSGRLVTGLAESAFSITEDGDARDIAAFIGSGDQPVTAVMLIDHSGSMADGQKMPDAIDAALAFLDELEDGRDSLGVIAFDDAFTVLGDLQVVDEGARAGLRTQIGALYPDGGTAYYDAIYKATSMLKGVPGRKVVLALTDGDDTSSSRTDLGKMIEYVQDSNVVVFTIGLGADVQSATLARVARETGGQYYEEPSGSDLAQLYTDIARSLQDEYSLTYRSPTPQSDGTTRQVGVVVETFAGEAVAVGSYAVGGTFVPSLNAWSCVGGAVLLALAVAMLVAPGLYDRVRGRGRLAGSEQEPEPRPVPAPAPKPSPAAPGAATCPVCGEALRPGARFCKACGTPQAAHDAPQATACANCGAALRPGARFCANCGQRV